MSGGHFNYKQYEIGEIADEIESLVESNASDSYPYSEETIFEFRTGLHLLRMAHIYAQRIDWLVSCDDGEDSFHRRLKEELDRYTLTIGASHHSDKGYELSTHEKQAEFAKKRCWCHTCRPITMDDMRMVLCPECGNKRCPKATNHSNACTNSNEPNQEGSLY